MDITKLSTGITDRPGTDVAKNNVVPIRPSSSSSSAAASAIGKPAEPVGDRFTPSSSHLDSLDGVADSVTLSQTAISAASAREARVAAVISSVQNGTYQVDSKAVATALISGMLGADEAPRSE